MKFDADLQIDSLDRTNLLNDIITVLGQMKINVLNIHADASDDGRALIKLKIGVDDAGTFKSMQLLILNVFKEFMI